MGRRFLLLVGLSSLLLLGFVWWSETHTPSAPSPTNSEVRPPWRGSRGNQGEGLLARQSPGARANRVLSEQRQAENGEVERQAFPARAAREQHPPLAPAAPTESPEAADPDDWLAIKLLEVVASFQTEEPDVQRLFEALTEILQQSWVAQHALSEAESGQYTQGELHFLRSEQRAAFRISDQHYDVRWNASLGGLEDYFRSIDIHVSIDERDQAFDRARMTVRFHPKQAGYWAKVPSAHRYAGWTLIIEPTKLRAIPLATDAIGNTLPAPFDRDAPLPPPTALPGREVPTPNLEPLELLLRLLRPWAPV